MIIVTAYDKERDFAALYSEWVGHTPKFKGVQMNSFWIGARDDGKWVGALQYLIIDDPIWDRRWALVENVYVAKDYRRQGIGKRLMQFAEEEAYQFECDFIKLTSALNKTEAHALYKSLGYKDGLSFTKGIHAQI